jgi:hypothetical protein
LADILKEMGKAFLIAFVLAIVVDTAQKFKLLNEFAEHISLHIMGRKLPPELRNYVEKYLDATFIRPQMEVTYQLETWEGKPDRVKLTKKIEYKLRNCREDELKYDWQYRVDDSWFSDFTATIDRMGKSTPETGNTFQDSDLTKKITPETGGSRFLERVSIRGTASYDTASAPAPEYSFIAESTECFPSGYSEHLTATHPILYTKLIVNYDPKKFAVKVYVPLAPPIEAFKPAGTGTNQGRFWEIKQPILPGQSFFTIWRKLPPAPPATDAPAAPAAPAAAAQTPAPAATPPPSTSGPTSA